MRKKHDANTKKNINRIETTSAGFIFMFSNTWDNYHESCRFGNNVEITKNETSFEFGLRPKTATTTTTTTTTTPPQCKSKRQPLQKKKHPRKKIAEKVKKLNKRNCSPKKTKNIHVYFTKKSPQLDLNKKISRKIPDLNRPEVQRPNITGNIVNDGGPCTIDLESR